jgi:hypothetical protein
MDIATYVFDCYGYIYIRPNTNPFITASIKTIKMEVIVRHSVAYDGNCEGAVRNKRDVMITFLLEEKEEFLDVFLTNEQAILLQNNIKKAIKSNKTKEK